MYILGGGLSASNRYRVPHLYPSRPISQPWAHTQFASFISHLQVGIYSENSSRWIVADQGVMMAGAVGAVRGSTAPLEELAFIMRHARCCGLVLQDVEALRKMAPELLKVRCLPPLMDKDKKDYG